MVKKQLLNVCVLLGISMLAASCVEEDYDLNEVDAAIGPEINLTLPSSSTGKLYLKNIIELEDDGVIQEVVDQATGETIYCVRSKGETNNTSIEIAEMRIKDPTFEDLKSNPIGLLPSGNLARGVHKAETSIANECSYVIDEEDATFYLLLPKDSEKEQENVISVKHVVCNGNKLTMSLTVSGFNDFIRSVYVKDLTLTIPADFEFEQPKFMGSLIPEEDIRGNVLCLSGAEGKKFDIVNGELEMKLEATFTGIKTGETFVFENRKVSFRDAKFLVGGTFSVKLEDMALTPTLLTKVQSEGLQSILTTEIGMSGSADFEDDFVMTHFSGELQYDIDDVEPIVLNDLPDFLNDKDVVLDLDNPMFLVKAEYPFTADVIITNITLTSKYTDASRFSPDPLPASVPVNTGDVVIGNYNGSAICYLAEKETTSLPDDYAGATWHRVENLAKLIEKIPDEIAIDVAPVRMDADEVEIKDYNVIVDYEVYAPLAFGPDFKLIYKETEDGLAEDFNDMEDLEDLDGSLVVKAQIDSDLDAALSLSLIPLDKDKNRIADMEAISISVPARAKNHPIEIALKARNGKKLSDILLGRNGARQLDGIEYEARIENPVNGAVLKSSNNICLHDIKLTLQAKMSVEL